MKIKHNECQKLKKRLKLVSQPNFRFKMKQELVDLQEQIRKEIILNRKSKNQKRVVGNSIDVIESTGKPPALQKLHDMEYDLSILNQKNKKLLK